MPVGERHRLIERGAGVYSLAAVRMCPKNRENATNIAVMMILFVPLQRQAFRAGNAAAVAEGRSSAFDPCPLLADDLMEFGVPPSVFPECESDEEEELVVRSTCCNSSCKSLIGGIACVDSTIISKQTFAHDTCYRSLFRSRPPAVGCRWARYSSASKG